MDGQISTLHFGPIISESQSVLNSNMTIVFHALLKKQKEKLNDLNKIRMLY